MVRDTGDRVSVYLLCLISGFDVEIGGAKLDDTITLWTYEGVAIATLVADKCKGCLLRESLCVSKTLRGRAIILYIPWSTNYVALKRSRDPLLEEFIDCLLLACFPPFGQSHTFTTMGFESHL